MGTLGEGGSPKIRNWRFVMSLKWKPTSNAEAKHCKHVSTGNYFYNCLKSSGGLNCDFVLASFSADFESVLDLRKIINWSGWTS